MLLVAGILMFQSSIQTIVIEKAVEEFSGGLEYNMNKIARNDRS